MDKWQALQAFWESFGLPAFKENSVPDEVWDENLKKMVKLQMPYITYEVTASTFGTRVASSASIWYRDTSWKAISNKAKTITDATADGKTFAYDGGGMIVWTNNASDMSEPTDDMVRRIRLDVTIEFIGG